jgi:hypothetical protein
MDLEREYEGSTRGFASLFVAGLILLLVALWFARSGEGQPGDLSGPVPTPTGLAPPG